MVKSIRKRYVAFRWISRSHFSKNEILEALKKALPKTDERYPLGVEHIRVIEYDEKTSLGIIRCDNKTLDIIRPSFEKITEASTNFLKAEVLGVSGTIKALKRKFSKFLRK